MFTPIFTGQFKRDRKLIKKRRKNMDKLTEVMALLINERPLLPKHENHPLHGKWQGTFECHVEPNWLLIYDIDPAAREVTFHRTGSHSDLY